VDGVAKVTGAALYVDDLPIPNALHGMTKRSSVPHGVLRGIELDPAFDWASVTVATAADIPGVNTAFMYDASQPALVPIGGTIRHVDEPVALVAAPSRREALDALAHMSLVVDPLPAVLDMAIAEGDETVVSGTDNVYQRYAIDKGDALAALSNCDHVIEGEYRTPAQEQMYIEPQGMVARWDDDTLCVAGSMQCPFYVHKALKVAFDLTDERAIVTQAVTGGAFGGKEEYPNILSVHVGLLSLKAGAPVKMIYDREEDIGATTKRHPALIRHRLGFNKDGSFVAADIDVTLDGGAYVTLSKVVLSRAVLHAAGPYRLEHVRIRGKVVATNHPPHGAFRGFGAPQTTFAYERQVARAARLLQRDPFEIRRQNMLRIGDSTATSQVLSSSVASDKVLDAVEQAARSQPLRTANDEQKRGRGVCLYFHGAGFTGSGEARLAGRAEVALRADGVFEVRTSQTDMGQGALTTFVQIAQTVLEVPSERITVANPDTSKVPNSGPTVASRTCMVVGGVVERAARALRERVETWGRERDVKSTFSDLGSRMAVEEGEFSEIVQYNPPTGVVWEDETYTGAAYAAFGMAACLVDVAVDPETAEIVIERCVHAVDVGKAIHPLIVKGQIEGGTLQALGWALLEDVTYENGRVRNRTMTNCIVPTSKDAPEMETILVEEPFPFGPHGAKGVGEIPMDGPAAAVADAVADALQIEFCELPISPERVGAAFWEAL